MLPDRVAILKCGGRLSAIRNEADKNRLDRKQVRCLQRQWLFGGQATSATRPQDLPAAMSEVPGLRKNQKSRPLRRLADSAMGRPSARTSCASYTGPRARRIEDKSSSSSEPANRGGFIRRTQPRHAFRCAKRYGSAWSCHPMSSPVQRRLETTADC
jgi:hypothetical protein